MNKGFKQEIITALVLIILLALLINPFGIWMPTEAQMLIVAGLVVIFALFSGLVWRERGGDERQLLHRLQAGRFGYLAGALVLVVGIVVQSLRHEFDPWLAWALGLMIVVRIAGFIHSQIKN